MMNPDKYVLHNNLYLERNSKNYQQCVAEQQEVKKRKRRRTAKPVENQMSFYDLMN